MWGGGGGGPCFSRQFAQRHINQKRAGWQPGINVQCQLSKPKYPIHANLFTRHAFAFSKSLLGPFSQRRIVCGFCVTLNWRYYADVFVIKIQRTITSVLLKVI